MKPINLMKYTAVQADEYKQMKKSYEEMGLPSDHLYVADMNAAAVPTKTDKTAKDSKHNLEVQAELNQKRFGLESRGLGGE